MHRRSFLASFLALFAGMLPKRRIQGKRLLDPSSRWGKEAGKMWTEAVEKSYREAGYLEIDTSIFYHGKSGRWSLLPGTYKIS